MSLTPETEREYSAGLLPGSSRKILLCSCEFIFIKRAKGMLVEILFNMANQPDTVCIKSCQSRIQTSSPLLSPPSPVLSILAQHCHPVISPGKMSAVSQSSGFRPQAVRLCCGLADNMTSLPGKYIGTGWDGIFHCTPERIRVDPSLHHELTKTSAPHSQKSLHWIPLSLWEWFCGCFHCHHCTYVIFLPGY